MTTSSMYYGNWKLISIYRLLHLIVSGKSSDKAAVRIETIPPLRQQENWVGARCTYKHISLFSLIKRWDLNWGTLTCELFTDPADLSSSFKRASSKNNHN